MAIIEAEGTAFAGIFVDNQDLSSFEVYDIRYFLTRFKYNGKVKTVGSLSVIFDRVEANFFHMTIASKYCTIVLLLQEVRCLWNISMKVSLRGSNNGAIDPIPYQKKSNTN